MKVPLLDLKAQYAAIQDEIAPAVESVLESQYFINGPEVKELEKLVAEYSQSAHAIGVSSGTDALLVSLMALGIGEDLPACRAGDACPGCPEVITTPFTFFATAGSIWRVGARPVFVDIEPDTFNIDPAKIEAAVTERTTAIMPVHLFGQVAEMDPIMEIAGKHDLSVIEDAAQAIGAKYKGRPAGSIGTTGCFSFFPSKNLGGFGDGGMVTTQDDALARRLTMCRGHGGRDKYHNEFVGGNFRLDTLQAAVLIVKLGHLDEWSAARRANAAKYDQLLADCPDVTTPVVRDYNESIYNQYVIRVPRRDELQAHLKEQGVGSNVYYPVSLHQQECFAALGYKGGEFPESEKATQEVLALPVYPELSDEQIEFVARTVNGFYG
ncbi:transcriptional regulator [Candidatus Peregrinibacteria bacterium]|jgi:dTDP-4-amino-4,6-dideoxygalactose transaminase|nr:transcriptional regulator [Candidatus Peregrinibacteria bacterium]